MKRKILTLIIVFSCFIVALSCKKENKENDPPFIPTPGGSVSIGGDPSPISAVGESINSSSFEIAGLSSFSATVTEVEDGISTYEGSVIIKNSLIKSIFENIDEIIIDEDTVYSNSIKFKNTVEGIQLMSTNYSGVLVKYDAKVGDKYKVGNTNNYRTVVSRSTDNDHYWGGMYIRVIQIDETPSSLSGIQKISYFANHRFGLVGIKITFDDETSELFPLFASTQNP